MSSRATTPEELVDLWREQLQTYPATPEGMYARKAVELCAKELEAVLDGGSVNDTKSGGSE